MGGGGNEGDGEGDWAVLPSPPLAEVTLALVGKVGTGKSATANCILGNEAFVSEFSFGSVTETCQKNSTTIQDGCVTRTVNIIDTPGLFDMEISIEDARKEVVKCIEMSNHGIHTMLMVFSAATRFSCEEQSTIESIKQFFGDKILDHIILVFTHGDAVGGENSWKKLLTGRSPGYLQDLFKLCQNRVLLFDNKTSNIQHREIQRKKLLDAVDFVISRNCGKVFSYQMIPHIQDLHVRQDDTSFDGHSAEKLYEQLSEFTKRVDGNLNNTEEAARESLEKSQKEHDNVRQEITNVENLRRLDDEKHNEQKEEINRLKEDLEKERQEAKKRIDEEIKRLMESLEKANAEKDNYKRALRRLMQKKTITKVCTRTSALLCKSSFRWEAIFRPEM